MLKKLYEKENGPLTAPSVQQSSAPAAKSEPVAKPKEMPKEAAKPATMATKVEDKKTTTAPAAAAKTKDEDEYEDDLGWDEDAWGETDFGEVDTKKKPDPKKEPAKAEPKKGKDDLEDKFNKVISTNKETGGLLASIGLKNKDIANEDASLEGDSEEAPHNKSDLFDTSKDRVAKKGGKADQKKKDSDEDFDLGFNSNKKPATEKKEAAADPKKAKTEAEMTEAEQKREIEEQFKMIYEGDPELRKTLERSDVANFTVEEKFQIIEAYMAGGGAAGL